MFEQIPFDTFWKVSSIVLFLNVLNVFKAIIPEMKEINKLKETIKQNVGQNRDGLKKLGTRLEQKVIKYDFIKETIYLFLSIPVSIILNAIYFIAKDIPYLSNSEIYLFVVKISTYIGLFPVLVATIFFFRLTYYLLQLYSLQK